MSVEILNSQLTQVFNWILESSLMASILVGIILFIKLVLKNKLTPRWQYIVWIIVIFRLLLPSAPESSYSIYNIFLPNREIPPTVNVSTVNYEKTNVSGKAVTIERGKGSFTQSKSHHKNYSSVYKIVLYVWLFGVVCFGIFMIVLNKRVYMYIKKQPLITEKRIINLLEHCKRTMSIKRNIPIVVSGNISSPTVLGFIKPRILLSENHMRMLDDDQLRFIFYHELAHVKRKDVGMNCLMNSLLILHWFNPILWYAYYRMREDQEIACDALALTYIDFKQRINYGYTIINLLEDYSDRYQIPSLANLTRNKLALKRRIVMIKQFQKKSYRWSLLGLTAVISISAISLVNAEEPTQKAKKLFGENQNDRQISMDEEAPDPGLDITDISKKTKKERHTVVLPTETHRSLFKEVFWNQSKKGELYKGQIQTNDIDIDQAFANETVEISPLPSKYKMAASFSRKNPWPVFILGKLKDEKGNTYTWKQPYQNEHPYQDPILYLDHVVDLPNFEGETAKVALRFIWLTDEGKCYGVGDKLFMLKKQETLTAKDQEYSALPPVTK
ncbi:M56 family metallopeptidase [Bacillus sp. 123MFChir2]|uniref:M56 family metallopeptidase n=1 Tax=Bacillus sp. 123MFChir2 TaxID=1169144 RepID=UPI00036DFE67|nr:M56 family metallopeptidase [Bacillus sp. 123MFChir2]